MILEQLAIHLGKKIKSDPYSITIYKINLNLIKNLNETIKL